jgi:NAD-dependent dihydropyrimidine dehydrogenase PreA subunit
MLSTAVDLLKDLVQTCLRFLPFPTRTGLIRIGNPGPESPVLLTCNFDLTVRRVKRALRGLDCYLLVASSHGINVWCAAAGGHLTANDVVSVIKTSGISELVEHRRLVLPQLAATGVERKPIEERTGWRTVFGPVRAEDIPAYLANHFKKTPEMRKVRFELSERLDMAVMWAFPISIAPLIPLLIWWPWLVPPFLAAVWGIALFTFVAFPWLPGHPTGVESAQGAGVGGTRWVRYLIVFDPRLRASLPALVLFFGALGLYLWVLGGGWGWGSVIGWGLVGVAITLVISLDLTGSTPVYKSGLHEERLLTVHLVDEKCTGKAMCEQVCPKNCFEVDAKAHKATIVAGHECVQCGACIVQCPEDALLFTYPDGRSIQPEEIRRHKLNMLGDRSKTA